MITQKDGEPRLAYLVRVLRVYMDQYGDNTIRYDDSVCDGMALADDFEAELVTMGLDDELQATDD